MKKALSAKDDDHRHLLTSLRVSLSTLGLAWIEEVLLIFFNVIYYFVLSLVAKVALNY